MRLDWNEVRARASRFVQEWGDAHYEKGETQSFYNDFFEVFGVPRRRVASFERRVNVGPGEHGFIDLFWPGKLLVEQKSAGRDLRIAKEQAKKYFPGLKDHELPRYVLLSDFQNFELYDLDIDPDRPVSVRLQELPDRVQDFGFLVGQEKRVFKDQDPANVAAAELMGSLHEALEKSGYAGHDLERLLVRLLFCLFADDTGIWGRLGLFEDFVAERTREDGTDLGPLLIHLFEVLNTPEDRRQRNLDADLARFPYINGDLFGERLPPPAFDKDMRDRLLGACGFNWEKISPAIFGSLFQSVMNKAERRKKGAHYTSEKNILKVVEPLFMDDLRAEFTRIKERRDTGRKKALEDFHARISKLTFFDPACGCGNFLVIAYREMRLLEIDVLRELYPKGQLVTDIGLYTRVNVDRFYGIEIGEFPARIAEVAMWMMDHIMNARLSAEFGESYLRIPLRASPNIRHGDALEIDWAEVLPPQSCSYVLGNPPFIGAKMQSEAQRAQVIRLAALGKSGGSLDYVAAWFIKAGAYVRAAGANAPRIGFVATNSITQGEQVAQLWPVLFRRYGLEIAFAHRTFQWMSDARGKANVHCVIIGLVSREDEPKEKRLYFYESAKSDPIETKSICISPYLIAADRLPSSYICISEQKQPINGARPLITGTQPLENDELTFNFLQMQDFILKEPGSARFFRPFPGADEFLNGKQRWILHTDGASPSVLRTLPKVMERLERVRSFRANSTRTATKRLSDFPQKYGVTVIPSRPFLAIPQTSSLNREYIPIAWLKPPTIPSEKLRILIDAELYEFAIITSRMHMTWMRLVTGRMKSDYMYSVGVVYNNFPLPIINDNSIILLNKYAQDVLDARDLYADQTLADLYDPLTMPPELRKAHRALDLAVDRLYRREPFSSDRERVEHLFGLYEKMTATLFTTEKPKRRRTKSDR